MSDYDQVSDLLSKIVKNQGCFRTMPLEDRWWIIKYPDIAAKVFVLIIQKIDEVKELRSSSRWIEKDARRVIKNNLKLSALTAALVGAHKKFTCLSSEDVRWASWNSASLIKLFIGVIRNKELITEKFDIRIPLY